MGFRQVLGVDHRVSRWQTYWLADGFHRVAAAKKARLDEVEVDVRQELTRRRRMKPDGGAYDWRRSSLAFALKGAEYLAGSPAERREATIDYPRNTAELDGRNHPHTRGRITPLVSENRVQLIINVAFSWPVHPACASFRKGVIVTLDLPVFPKPRPPGRRNRVSRTTLADDVPPSSVAAGPCVCREDVNEGIARWLMRASDTRAWRSSIFQSERLRAGLRAFR